MLNEATYLGMLGRRVECDALDGLLTAARRGRSATLVLRGEAGVGKSALIEHLVRRAAGCEVLRASGVESEMELPFASVQQLCAPLLNRIERLPGPQQDALATAFGLVQGDAPDRFLVGLAVMTLLSTAATARPVVAVIDDAQWLDRVSAQTLAFVARRLTAESTLMIFAVREPTSIEHFAGIETLEVRGLSVGDAHALLDAVVPGPLDPQVRDRIVAETRGNPLALLELPQGRTSAELTFGFQDPDRMPVATRIEQDYLRRLEALPPQTRKLLLTAAVDPVGDPAVLRRAAGFLGISVDVAPAKEAGLVQLGGGFRFRHSLVRSAVYRAATPEQRREVHHALAEATDPSADPDRRAWHRAQACAGPDEVVAGELECSADRAQRRGGVAAAATLLQRAAALTPDAHRRGGRALAAAEAEYTAGAPEAAAELIVMARLCPLDEQQQARLAQLEARVLFARTRGTKAAQLLAQAARRLESVDARSARETYVAAISAAIVAARLGGSHGIRSVAAAALAGPPAAQPPSPSDALLDGLAVWLTEGDASFPVMRKAFRDYVEAPLTSRPAKMRWLLSYFVALQVGAHQLWDFEGWNSLATKAVNVSREVGALSTLPMALMSLAGVKLHAGDLTSAAHLIEEGNSVTTATRFAPIWYTSLNMAAWRGNEEATLHMLDRFVLDAAERGEAYVLGMGGYVRAVLYNGLGRHDLALAGARDVGQRDVFSFRGWALAEHVEAAVRVGDLDEAAEARTLLGERTRASGTEWGLGIQARCDALLETGDRADRYYRDAIGRLERSGVSLHQARAHLLYGEWLRRQGRRREARDRLRTAHEMCTEMGLDAFGDRAVRELRATGGIVHTRAPARSSALTPQESQIASLAAGGLTNPEIGARLFISPHTVEWHLRKVFVKLGISSRRQLAGVLGDGATASEKSGG
jgi:DNA-binding CsgD family transcriptional regulator